MAHPEEPTLPEDTGQRKNKNINNVLHDISRFLLSEIQRRAFLSPRSVKQQEGHGDNYSSLFFFFYGWVLALYYHDADGRGFLT